MTSPVITQQPVLTIELKDDDEALAFAKHLANRIGRTITVSDADGDRIHIISESKKN